MNKLLPILCFLIIASCSKEIPSDQLVERQGIYYEINSQTPFSGTATMFYENGQLKERLFYKKGKKNGIQETFFSNGQLESKEELLNGYINVGTKSNYYRGGQLKNRDIYSKDGDGVSSESYFSNGQLVSKIRFDIVEPYVEFFSDGNVKMKFNLDKDGNGTKEYYHENGQLKSKGNVKDRDNDGLWESFYENGQPKEKSNYKEGELDGLREVYEPGYLKHKTNYVMGKRNGPHERYFDNGVIIEKGNYTNNQRTGIWYERWTEYQMVASNKPYFSSRVDCGRYGYNREPYGYLQFLDPDTGEEESRTKLHYSTYKINCVE